METRTPICSLVSVTLCSALAPGACSTQLDITAKCAHLGFMGMPSSPRTVPDVAALPVEQKCVTQELDDVTANMESPDLSVIAARRAIMGIAVALDASVAAVVPALPVQVVILALASVSAFPVSPVLAVSSVLQDTGVSGRVVAQSVTVKGAHVTRGLVSVNAVTG